MSEPRKLFTFEFVGCCIIAFLAMCNVSVFYNLFNYLQTLGIPAELRGLVVGTYSLTAMVLYVVASPFLDVPSAPRTMLLGMVLMGASGVAYLFVHSFWGLMALRMVNGAGQFCTSGAVMTLLVSIIPAEKSGQAFGMYSVGMLLSYAAMPTLMDALAPFMPSAADGYAVATVSLLPAAWIVSRIRRRRKERPLSPAANKQRPAWADIGANVIRLPIVLLLLLNISYVANWGSLFFLFKGFAHQHGLANVGVFFTAQMFSMILVRLLAVRLFDAIEKAWLVGICFLTVALGYLALDHLPGMWAVPLVGVLFGLGMGMGYPAINGLMFEVSVPRLRGLNANLMLSAVQAGYFLGPVVGGALVALGDYHVYFVASSGLACVSAALSLVWVKSASCRPVQE